MTVAHYWASKIRELIAEARASGVKIEGFSECCGCSTKIGVTIDAGTTSEEVMISDD